MRVYHDCPADALAAVAILCGRGYFAELAELPAGALTARGSSDVRLWRVSPLLEEVMAQISPTLPPGARVTDLGCGCGREAVWLALRGYSVDAVDVLPDALAKAADLARRNGVKLNLIERDLGTGDLGEGVYDLVCLFRFLRRPLLPAIRRAVGAGGWVIIETFHQRDAGRPGRGRDTSKLLCDGELTAAFSGWKILLARDGVERDGRWLSQLVAQRGLGGADEQINYPTGTR